MGQVFASCGHEVFDEQCWKGYYWLGMSGGEPALSYGNLCPTCVPVYRAVEAEDWEDAEKKLADVEPVTLMDILQGTYGGERKVENIGGIDWEVYEVPPKDNP